jgi:hypothetical protein
VRTEVGRSAFLYRSEEGLTIDGSKIAVSASDDPHRVAQSVAALLTGALMIGLSLSTVMQSG